MQGRGSWGSMLWSQFSAIFGEKRQFFADFFGKNIFQIHNIGPREWRGQEFFFQALQLAMPTFLKNDQGSMLQSQFSSILTNFMQNNGRYFIENLRYDQ
jgi:hypothetical protein